MANPFFNATYYNQQNKDVYVSGMDAYTHYVQFGASEALEGTATRKPAPWFDIEFYYENNTDLIEAELTPAQLFDHFANHGYKEGRAPNAVAQENVNADSLLTYALANVDLREAFGIDADATELTAAQYVDLAGHYYQFGYNEARPGLPSTEFDDVVVGEYDYLLTVGHDPIDVVGNNKTIYAGLEQNFLGAVTNTLESGDSIIAKDGSFGNKLIADLTLSISGTQIEAPAISATTKNIDIVELRAQTGDTDDVGAVQGNESHIDAENFKEVKEWISNNSRATIQIEDVRTAPDATTITLRNSDPDVGFRVYFDPEQLENGSVPQDSALTIKLADLNKPDSLEDVPVDGVSFKLGGQSYTVQSEEMGAATTHEEFFAALKAELGKNEALAGLVVTLNPADNTIILLDPKGDTFEKGGWKFINDEVPADGNIAYEQIVGDAEVIETLIKTNVVLDNVGRTSEGGRVDIGSLGDGGVQQFDVKVGASSWVSSLQSNSYLGRGPNTEAFLEVVNVDHLEGKSGNLTIGREFTSTDGRVVNGLINVRELNAADFTGNLKAGITLRTEAVERYLDDAEGVVDFNYTTGSGSDNLNLVIEDIALVNDPDFALNVDLGAGDDRLNLDLRGGRADKVSVNGGEGFNTIEVKNTSHGGIDAAGNAQATNKFASFENFQQYVVAGNTSTGHDFANLAGVEQVVVATTTAVNTRLVNLEDGATVTISGKNQTLGANNSLASQFFGDIFVTNSASEALTVNLDNTARLTGVLTANKLVIDGNNSAVRTLDLTSNGSKRDTKNAITEIVAAKVNTFKISGSQDLTTEIKTAANFGAAASARGNFVVDASELDANITLTLAADVVSIIDSTTDRTNTFTGAKGADDKLTFNGAALTTTQATTIKDFEEVNFKLTGAGTFDATNVTGVEEYNLQSGTTYNLSKLENAVNVNITTTAVTGVTGYVTLAGRGDVEEINVSLNSDGTDLGNWGNGANKLFVYNYKTVNLDLDNDSSLAQAYDFILKSEENSSNPSVVRELNLTGGREEAKNGLNGAVDEVTLNELNTSLTTIDLTGYAGKVTGALDDGTNHTVQAYVGDVKIKVGAWDIEWDVTAVAAGATNQQKYNTQFEFTDSYDVGSGQKALWTINNFNIASVGSNEKTELDVTGLGITHFTQLQIVQDTVNIGNTLITADMPSGEQTWEIVLTGVAYDDVTIDNFSNLIA